MEGSRIWWALSAALALLGLCAGGGAAAGALRCWQVAEAICPGCGTRWLPCDVVVLGLGCAVAAAAGIAATLTLARTDCRPPPLQGPLLGTAVVLALCYAFAAMWIAAGAVAGACVAAFVLLMVVQPVKARG